MKNQITIIMLAFLFAFTAGAQKRHEINLTLGAGDRMMVLDDSGILDYKHVRSPEMLREISLLMFSITRSYGLDYTYSVTPWFKPGGGITFNSVLIDAGYGNTYVFRLGVGIRL